jgi:hypothetical protein
MAGTKIARATPTASATTVEATTVVSIDLEVTVMELAAVAQAISNSKDITKPAHVSAV